MDPKTSICLKFNQWVFDDPIPVHVHKKIEGVAQFLLTHLVCSTTSNGNLFHMVYSKTSLNFFGLSKLFSTRIQIGDIISQKL